MTMEKRSRAGFHPGGERRAWALKKHRKEEPKIIPSCIGGSKAMREILLQQKEIAAEEAENLSLTYAEDDSDESEEDDWFSEAQMERLRDCEEVDEEEERIMDAFMSKDVGLQCTLVDTVLGKINENIQQEPQIHSQLDYSIVNLYKGVGKFLSEYKSGRLPKAFKRIPSFKHWEDVLYLTEPDKWSANAVFQATKIFASNLPPHEAQSFYSLVLLPRVRDDIKKNKRLNFYLCLALKKSIYRPKAFNNGILFPLCESGTCSLREAVIIGSIIRKISLPSPHPGVALLKLAGMEYRGTTSYFIKLFLDKKYCLAYSVIDGLVAHFMRFLEETRVLPVIWHQSLLSFVQRFRNELTEENRRNLEQLLNIQKHHLVTPEIKRELNGSSCDGEREDPKSTKLPAFVVMENRFDIPDVPMEAD